MKYFALFFSLLFFASSFAKTNVTPLSLFQIQIKDCELDLTDLQTVKSFSALYAEIQKKYLITSEKTLYRELYFQTKGEKRKIKITNDVVEIFRMDKDGRPTLLGIDPRHKNKTIQALVNQLILNAKTENDWQKTLELRENSLKIEIVRVDQKITQIKVLSGKNTNVLDCQVINTSEVCLCNK
jgi:hypothetical protein